MEVRIKDNNGYVDADWTIEDGVMIVPPKINSGPKDGDVVYIKAIYEHILIWKCGEGIFSFVDLLDGSLDFGCNCVCSASDIIEIRPATEEEKQKLFDKLKEEGWEWDAENRQLVKLKWKPVCGDKYYRPFMNRGIIIPSAIYWKDDDVDIKYYYKGWYFKTKDECQAFCDRLNEAINSVKP